MKERIRRLRTARVACCLAGASIFAGLIAPAALAGSHFTTATASSTSLTIKDQTQYNTARFHAADVWNALGGPQITYTRKGTDYGLRMYDYNGGANGISGEYSAFDFIRFNTYYMGPFNTDQERDAVSHEVGHSLGIGDHDTAEYSRILMYYANNSVTSPQPHDKEDFRDKWNLAGNCPQSSAQAAAAADACSVADTATGDTEPALPATLTFGPDQEALWCVAELAEDSIPQVQPSVSGASVPANVLPCNIAPPATGLTINRVSSDYALDFAVPSVLSQWADDVFVGRVQDRLETVPDPTGGVPRTVYSVEVLDVSKGDVAGVIRVAQRGGVNEATGRYDVDNDTAQLTPGDRFLFATKVDTASASELALTRYGMLKLMPSVSPEQALAAFSAAQRLVG